MLCAKPVGPRLLVQPLEASEVTVKGIVLPEEVREKESRAVIINVGQWYRYVGEEGVQMAPMDMRPGEVVVYERNCGTKVVLDLEENGQAEEYLVLHINEVLLVLTEVEVASRS